MSKDDEISAPEARNYVMARVAACLSALDSAMDGAKEILALFVDPADDEKGAERAELISAVDDAIGLAARMIQAAQDLYDDVDPTEGEDLLPEEDGHDDDEDDDDA